MPNYQSWDLVDEFRIYQAACLWCEIEPGISWLSTDAEHPEVQAVRQLLENAVRNGDLEAITDRVSSVLHDYHMAIVRRSGLRALAESKGQRPVFLFPEDRPTAQRAAVPESKTHVDAAELRPLLKQWIEITARTKDPKKYTKDDFLAGARKEVDKTITQNMFKEVWRSADLPEAFKDQGRRPGRRQ